MIVLISGMQRSGSTFSFNIARELLEARGLVHKEPANSLISIIENSDCSDHVIQKSHDIDEMTIRLLRLGALKSVCSVRKPEDAIASWMTTFQFSLQDSITHMISWIGMFHRIRHQSLIIPYELIEKRPARAAWKISQYLCPDASVKEVSIVVRKFSRARVKGMTDTLQLDNDGIKDIGFSYYDENTFFHRRHVGKSVGQKAENIIGKDEVIIIRDSLRPWVDDEGDLI